MTIRLFLLSPTTIFAARVNMPSGIVYPLDQIVFDGVTTGAYTDVLPGMTVLLGSAAGLDDYGRQRVRKDPTSTVLYVGRSSQGTRDGELNVSDNAYITVKNDYRVWAKMPKIVIDDTVDPPTATTYKDSDLAYTDQTSEPPPVANCGPGAAGTIDAGSSLFTVAFDGSASFAVAAGATISSYAWNGAGGNVVAGASNTANVTLAFTAGFYWVSLTVTDSNGKNHTARCPIYARNPASDTTIPHFQIDAHRITQAGQTMSVKVLSSIPVATYPDGTLAILFDGEPASAADRQNLLFVGWHHTDPAQISALRTGTIKDVTLELLDVAGKLNTLPGFPQTVERVDSPEKWEQMSDLIMDRYLHYLLQWHSTALDLADWTNTGTAELYEFVAFSSDGASLWDQVARRARSLVPNFVLTCNTLGQMFTKVDPMLQDSGSRTATIQATLTGADWSALRYTHQRPARFHWLRASALLTSETEITPIFSVSPGEAPAQGETAQEQGEQLAVSQAALNSQEGHRYARLNAPEGNFAITLAQGADQGIEPANMTWVRLTITAALAAQRGLAFTTARGLVHEINIRYSIERSGMVRTVDLIWERETDGVAAVTEPAPDEGIPPIEFEPPPTIYDPTPPPTTPTDLGFGTVYVMDEENLYRTRDFSAGSPTWASIGPTEIAVGHGFKDFILDPWAPATIGYLCSNEGVYISEDLDQVSPTFNLILTAAAIATAAGGATMTNGFAAKLIASSNIEEFLTFFYETGSGVDVWIAKTLDRGSSWAHVKIIDTAATSHDSEPGAVGMVPHLVSGDHIFYLATDDGDALYRSVDSGDTWALYDTFPDNIANPHVVHCPYEGNESGQILYVGTVAAGGGTPKGRLYKSVDGGANFTTISAITDRGVGVRRTGIEASPLDSDTLYAMVERFTGDAGHTFWISSNGGSSWTQAAASGYTATQSPAATSGFPYDAGLLYLLTANAVLVSSDGGATFTSKLGTGITTPMDFVSIDGYNMGVIVPLWTE